MANSIISSILAMNAVRSFPDIGSYVAKYEVLKPVLMRVWGRLGI